MGVFGFSNENSFWQKNNQLHWIQQSVGAVLLSGPNVVCWTEILEIILKRLTNIKLLLTVFARQPTEICLWSWWGRRLAVIPLIANISCILCSPIGSLPLHLIWPGFHPCNYVSLPYNLKVDCLPHIHILSAISLFKLFGPRFTVCIFL